MRTYYCYSCLKASVLVVNMLVLFLGLAVTGLSCWLLVSEHLLLSTPPSSLSLPPSLTLGLGLIVSTTAFLGCCGALTTSRCLLTLFTLLLTLATLGELTLVVLLTFKEVSPAPLVSLAVRQTVEEKYTGRNTGVVLYWDNVQQGLGCCGAEGPRDWENSIYNGDIQETREIGIGSAFTVRPPFHLPLSCCRNLSDPMTLQSCQSSSFTPSSYNSTFNRSIYFDEGCSDKILGVLTANLNYLLFAGLGLLLLELFGIVFSAWLCCTIQRIDDIKA